MTLTLERRSLPLARLLGGTPTPAARDRVVAELARLVEPIRLHNDLPPCDWRAGTLTMRTWGRCLRYPDGAHEIVVRLHADRGAWRRPGALVTTALHELAHLRYRSHGPRFWALLRRFLDQAAAAGIYHADEDDPAERGRGDAKLRGSAAHARAEAAGAMREAQRAATRAYRPGDTVRVAMPGRLLDGSHGQVERLGRTRVMVQLPRGRYWIPPEWLEPHLGDDLPLF